MGGGVSDGINDFDDNTVEDLINMKIYEMSYKWYQ